MVSGHLGILAIICSFYCVLKAGEPVALKELNCYPGYSGRSTPTLKNSLSRCGDHKLRPGGLEFCLDSCIFHDQKVAVPLRTRNRTVLSKKNLMRVLRLQFQHPEGNHSIPLLYRAFIGCHQKYPWTPDDEPCLETKPFWTCLKEKWKESCPRKKHYIRHRAIRSVTSLEDTIISSRKTRSDVNPYFLQFTYTQGASLLEAGGGRMCCNPANMVPRPTTPGEEYHMALKEEEMHVSCWWRAGPEKTEVTDKSLLCPGAKMRSATNAVGPSSPHQYSRLPHDLPPKMLAALLRLDPSLAINSSYPLPPLSGHSY